MTQAPLSPLAIQCIKLLALIAFILILHALCYLHTCCALWQKCPFYHPILSHSFSLAYSIVHIRRLANPAHHLFLYRLKAKNDF